MQRKPNVMHYFGYEIYTDEMFYGMRAIRRIGERSLSETLFFNTFAELKTYFNRLTKHKSVEGLGTKFA